MRNWRKCVKKLRDAQAKDANTLAYISGLTPYVTELVLAAKEVAARCKVKDGRWMTPDKCEVSSASKPDTYYVVDLTKTSPVDRGRLCSKNCNNHRDDVCPHVLCAMAAQGQGQECCVRDFVSPWSTLRGWAKQLGVPETPPTVPGGDFALFQLPTHDAVMNAMDGESVRGDALPADESVTGQKGRMKGGREAMEKKAKKLRAEVAAGKQTGVTTTPLDAVVPKKDRRPTAAKAARKCAECSKSQGKEILLTHCGGPRKNHVNLHNPRVNPKEVKAVEVAVEGARVIEPEPRAPPPVAPPAAAVQPRGAAPPQVRSGIGRTKGIPGRFGFPRSGQLPGSDDDAPVAAGHAGAQASDAPT